MSETPVTKWPLYIYAVPAPCVHEWIDITTLDSIDLRFMCIHCGASKFEARKQEPRNENIW